MKTQRCYLRKRVWTACRRAFCDRALCVPRQLHSRFMKLYSVRAHLHHYTELMDSAFIAEVGAA